MKSAPRLPHQQILSTTDTVGQPLDVILGIVIDNDGRRRMSITIGDDGPTALLVCADGTGPDLLPIAHRVHNELRNTTP